MHDTFNRWNGNPEPWFGDRTIKNVTKCQFGDSEVWPCFPEAERINLCTATALQKSTTKTIESRVLDKVEHDLGSPLYRGRIGLGVLFTSALQNRQINRNWRTRVSFLFFLLCVFLIGERGLAIEWFEFGFFMPIKMVNWKTRSVKNVLRLWTFF